MPLQSPNLDDRSFEQLLAQARECVESHCPAWTDQGPGDPGTVLLELFAHLTETLLFRLNRVPEKSYVEFLRLMGVTMTSPFAARVELTFRRKPGSSSEQPIPIARHTQVVSVDNGPGAQAVGGFLTLAPIQLDAGQEEAKVLALNCEWVAGEMCGFGTGEAAQSLRLSKGPVIAPTGDEHDLVIGVEVTANELEELGERVSALEYQGKSYRIWRESAHFDDSDGDGCVFVADRRAGLIYFAPAVQQVEELGLSLHPRSLAQFPAAQREIRAWYRIGGGTNGNLPAGAAWKVPNLPGVLVEQSQPATGGREPESFENALMRGPQELHSLRRAVTARDYELLALKSGAGISRARAYTRVELWSFAQPGSVELLLIPDAAGETDLVSLKACMLPHARERVRSEIDARRPLGTECVVRWAAIKEVRVRAKAYVHAEETLETVRQRIVARLEEAICPVPVGKNKGWPFGKTLHVSDVYHLVLSEPGVSHLDPPALLVDDVPDRDVSAIVRDPSMPRTWHVCAGKRVFRSQNDGDGWEQTLALSEERAQIVTCSSAKEGLIALLTRAEADSASRVYVSRDCGESWDKVAETTYALHGAAWVVRGALDVLLLATETGLQELALKPGASPVPLLVDSKNPTQGFETIVAEVDSKGRTWVALGSEDRSGEVWLSSNGGARDTFQSIGLQNEDVRVLRIQRESARAFLWAGVGSLGNEVGQGVFVRELIEGGNADWRAHSTDWQGGSCRDLAVSKGGIFAATTRAGVLRLASNRTSAKWESAGIDCGLPLDAKSSRLATVDAVGAVAGLQAEQEGGATVLAGGAAGLFERRGQGVGRWEFSSRKEYTERVQLPKTWLFSSGLHDIDVEYAP